MRIIIFLFIICCYSCAKKEEAIVFTPISSVTIDEIYSDSTSIRAVEVSNKEVLFAGSNGKYGYFEINTDTISKGANIVPAYFKSKNSGVVDFLEKKPAFRSLANTKDAFFILSIDNPALLYRIHKSTGKIDLVYIEQVEGVFYDTMTFWNDQEGIAMGDPIEEGCLSIIITRNGGASWEKKDCSILPETIEGEAAFAASDTNLKVLGNHTWIVTGGVKSRVLYSPNKGESWKLYDTPILQGSETSGGYSMDFYDESHGIIYGGDYTKPEVAISNIVTTVDGGKTWTTTADNANQGYKSCVQYIPGSNGKELIALGFTGISYSQDGGNQWKEISKEPLLSFRFLNDSVAYAGGRNRLVRLSFHR
ncbi:oxidoreductase [uncultured Dokdonia sp.]|uniref:WD40/YVTN/BNR-like repeat-containing protein n=1 Tax=uncultured Dokdonia sp. TaxID=575653 RepID=UPI002628D28B|nr:oxidoreductase [uncultured Dokdonia sp.]